MTTTAVAPFLLMSLAGFLLMFKFLLMFVFFHDGFSLGTRPHYTPSENCFVREQRRGPGVLSHGIGEKKKKGQTIRLPPFPRR
jgi:hypothetical protein